MDGWGQKWDADEWNEELAFHKWRIESVWSDMVLLEVQVINLESQDPDGWISKRDRKRLGLG